MTNCCFHISGKPFHPKVVNARKVRVEGGWNSILDASGMMRLMVNQPKEIKFDVSEAGPGRLYYRIIPVEVQCAKAVV